MKVSVGRVTLDGYKVKFFAMSRGRRLFIEVSHKIYEEWLKKNNRLTLVPFPDYFKRIPSLTLEQDAEDFINEELQSYKLQFT